MHPLVGVLTALVRRFNEANLVAQSAALAFYALLSLAPLLLILLVDHRRGAAERA